MDGEEQKQNPEGTEQTPPTGQQADPTPPAQTQEGEGKADDDVKDSHGQPGINKERHDKEVAELNAQIAELQAQIAQNAETKEGREKLEQELANIKTQMADNEVAHKLELAGCKNQKAAKALLDDYEGDVAKLKAECPYLFAEEKQSGSTGAKPQGAASGSTDDKLAVAMGIKKGK